MNPAMARRLDIMLHVADEQRFVRIELVFLQDLVDFFRLVPDPEIRTVEERAKAGRFGLNPEMVEVNRAQEKGAQLAAPAKLQKIARVRKSADRILHLFEPAMKPR